MKIPRNIIIFGQKWAIKQVSKDDISANADDCGECKYDEQLILLDKTQDKYDLEHTLYHEAMHAMMHRTGIRQAISDELNEVIAENVATFIMENVLDK